MTSWYLDAGKPGCSVSLVSSSDLTISGSEIVSNMECSAFAVTGVVDGHNSEIQIIRSSHQSKWNVVLPLVDSSDNQPKWGDGMETKNTDNADSEPFGIVSIFGVGLRMLSQHFALGTGPLFSFGVSEQGSSLGVFDCGVRMETSLVGSTLVNMTSSSRMSLGTQQFGSEVRQLVVGSCVAESTNHDSGTGMMSSNLGGNVMCLNTSFSSCVRTGNADTDLEFSFENRTQTILGRFALDSTSEATSVTYTLCTFNTMTVAVGNGGGAAIFVYEAPSSLTVRTCFFHTCTCTGNSDDGGAIFFRSKWHNRLPVFVSHSSFTQCTATQHAGSLCVMCLESLFLDFCFFDSSTAYYDGAAIVESTIITISNTAFVDCASTTRGGALTLFTETTLSILFCQFRGCSSTNHPNGKDIFFGPTSTEIDTSKILSCDTTSATPNVLFFGDSQSSESLVPRIGTTPTVNSVVVTIDNDEATVVVETQEAIKGTLSVLLNGSIVPRLVHVVFGDPETDTTIGTTVVSSGPNGILPSATYKHHKNSFATDLFPPPTVRTAEASLKDWNTTEIVVEGVSLKTGTYRMEVENGEEKQIITLTRWNFTTLTGTAPLYPSTAEGRLEWATEYKVTKVMWIPKDKQAEEEVTLWDTITFTTPAEPPRIEGAGCSLNGLKDILIVELNGRALSSSDLIAVISGSSGPISSSGGLFNVTSTKCFVNFSIGLSEDDSHVMFGGHYDLLSVGSESSSLVVNSGLVIDVDHPPRIASIVVPEEVTTSTFDLSASGSNLPSGKTYTVTLTSDRTFEITFSSATAGTSTVKIGGTGEVQFDTEYTIKSMIRSESGKDDEHILFSESTFKTPCGPTLSSISCDFDTSDADSVKVSFSTERMPSANFKLAVENMDTPSETVELSITSGALSSGFVVVEVYKQTGTLKYGTNYRVTKMWSGSVVVVLANRLFSTPPEPIRITEADCSLGGDQQKSALVTLKGVKLGGGKEFNVTVQQTVGSAASGEDIVLSGTLSGTSLSTQHTHSVEIFGVSNALISFDTKYLITRFDVEDSVSVLDADATFFVPAEPPRIVDLEKRQLNNDRTRMLVFLEGRALLSRTGKVSLTKENTLLEWLSDVAVVNDTHCTVEFAVGEEETVALLKYGITYTLKGSWTESSGFHVEDGIIIRIPFPPKITGIKCVFVDSRKTSCIVVLTGTDLIVGNSLNVTLNDSLSVVVRITSESEGRTNGISIGMNGMLKYGTTYEITSLEPTNEADGVILFEHTLSFTTEENRIVELFVSEGGIDSTADCGVFAAPCSSIVVGWKGGAERGGSEGVVLRIVESARFGGGIWVGQSRLEIGSVFWGESWVEVEEGMGWEGKEEGVVGVGGGSLLMTGLTLRLPRGSMFGERKGRCVVSGFGECVVSGVVVVERWEGEGVGMGVVKWSGGSLRLSQISMKSLWMESETKLIECSSKTKEVRLEMSDCVFVEVESRDASLVAFSSTLPSSHFEMSGCVFLWTKRVETRMEGERVGVIHVSTSQESTTMSKCVFSDCGTLDARNGGRKRGGVVVVEVGSESVLDRKEVRIVDCIVMDSSPLWSSDGERGSGGVVVWREGKGQIVVDVGGSWFEETGVSREDLERDSLGVPIVSRKRKIVHSLSSDVPAGLVVGGGGCVPVIVRRGSSFSGCSLRVERKQTETAAHQNADEL